MVNLPQWFFFVQTSILLNNTIKYIWVFKSFPDFLQPVFNSLLSLLFLMICIVSTTNFNGQEHTFSVVVTLHYYMLRSCFMSRFPFKEKGKFNKEMQDSLAFKDLWVSDFLISSFKIGIRNKPLQVRLAGWLSGKGHLLPSLMTLSSIPETHIVDEKN